MYEFYEEFINIADDNVQNYGQDNLSTNYKY